VITSELIETIQGMKTAGVYSTYIDYIRFPFYRNLELDTKITFPFPVTAFVGRNGGGKSSTLQALFGCPGGNSLGSYWFSTPLDPIKESKRKDKPCFIYSYKLNGVPVEVLKARIHKAEKLDYWEPSRPILKYGMTLLEKGARNPTITMNVVYLDFRSIISAFNKYFYFHKPIKQTKQDYLRNKAKKLKAVIESKKELTEKNGKVISKTPVWLAHPEVESLSRILGKEYSEVAIIEHKLFRTMGTSVFLKTNHSAYSEAFAGSGETAAAVLVSELSSAPENSLVLLDEPEVSLHPGAQKELINYILTQSKLKKLQVVISTHSPSIVETLPMESIKVFDEMPNGKIHVHENISAGQAFFFIGHSPSNRLNLVVEDELAEKMVRAVLKEKGNAFASVFNVQHTAGGAPNLFRKIEVFKNEHNIRRKILLDGDQKRVASHFDPAQLRDVEKTVQKLDQKIKEQTNQQILFFVDGGKNGGNTQQQIDERIGYLKFFREHVQYLPFDDPDTEIWNDEIAASFCSQLAMSDELKSSILAGDTPKRKFALLLDALGGAGSAQISLLHSMFVTAWANSKKDGFVKLKEILEGFVASHPAVP
jgi:predicted ATPase